MGVKSIFRELKYEIAKIEFANAVLDSTIFLFIVYFLNLWINLDRNYIFILVGAFFLIDMIIRIRLIDLREIEKKNPVVADILRTAYDYRDYARKQDKEQDVMVQGLYSDFASSMKQVKTGTFIDMNSFFKKTILCVFLSFLIIFSSVIQLDVEDFLNRVETESNDDLTFVAVKKEAAENTYADIFGEESEVVELEDEFFFDFSNNNFQLDYDQQREYQLEEFESFDQFYSDLESDASFSEDISIQDRELVKAYFSE